MIIGKERRKGNEVETVMKKADSAMESGRKSKQRMRADK
jgi:hypothetical protein